MWNKYDWTASIHLLKYVSKCVALIVKTLDNFLNFQPTEVFSSGMCSQSNENNFQEKITGVTEIYTGENWRRKFSFSRKNDIFG